MGTPHQPSQTAPQTALSLRHITLPDIITGFDHNTFDASDLVTTYLARIKEVNHNYNAVVQTNPNALTIAHALSTELKRIGRRGPLHGVPILLKDNMPTLDNTDTTCGSLALVGARPAREAAVVTALRDAGAVVLGKANMAAWSGFRSTSGCSGWSATGGQTRGVYYPGMKASGSSSGSAVGVALGMCFAALGTETCYSIVSPAEKSGIVGFKPTRCLISSEGIINASRRQDTVGVLARTVSDAMFVLVGILLASKHHASGTKNKLLRDLSSSCSNLDLSGVRIGVVCSVSETQGLACCKVDAFETALTLLQRAGATIVTNVEVPGVRFYESLSNKERQIILDTEMKDAINHYLASLTTNPHKIKSLQDVIDFTKTCSSEEYPQRNVEVLERAQAMDANDPLYRAMLAQEEYLKGEGGVEGALGRHRCDVLIVPSLSVTLQTFAAKAGSPVLSVPMGLYPANTPVEVDKNNGLVNVAPRIPFSAYIFGRATKDQDILRVGYVLEQVTKVRQSLQPYLEPRSEIFCASR